MVALSIMIEGQNGLTWPHWKRIVREVEDLGFAGLFRSDHFKHAQPPDDDSLEALKASGRALAGTPDMIIEQIHAYENAGAGEVMLQWLDLNDIGGLRVFAASVLPHL